MDAQAYFSYDLNFAGKPDEWICRNMMSDCVLQGPDSNKRTVVEIFNYEHKLVGQTVRIVYPGLPEEVTRTFYNSDYSTSSADISRLIMR